MMTKKFIAAEDDKYEDDFENLYHAGEKCNYPELKKYLTDIRFTDANFEFKKYYDTDEKRKSVLSDVLGCALRRSPACKQDTQCVDCLRLLVEKGAFFFDCEDSTSEDPSVFEWVYEKNGRFFSELDDAPINKKSMYNAVKFTLMHGGFFTFSQGDKDLLEKAKIMSTNEFDILGNVGDMYDKAKRKGKNPDEETLENWIRNAERGLVAVPLLDRANLEELKKDKDEKIKQLQLQIEEVKREYDENCKDYIKDMNMKTKVYRELSQGTPERDTKASELKAKMRERDTSGSKKTLRAFLKEKSGKKVSGKKAPRSSTKKQSVHE